MNTTNSTGTPGGLDPAELVFVTEHVTPTEASAVTAVIRGLLQEESDGRRLAPEAGQSPWQLGQRAIRRPLTPGPGRWRSFTG